ANAKCFSPDMRGSKYFFFWLAEQSKRKSGAQPPNSSGTRHRLFSSSRTTLSSVDISRPPNFFGRFSPQRPAALAAAVPLAMSSGVTSSPRRSLASRGIWYSLTRRRTRSLSARVSSGSSKSIFNDLQTLSAIRPRLAATGSAYGLPHGLQNRLPPRNRLPLLRADRRAGCLPS